MGVLTRDLACSTNLWGPRVYFYEATFLLLCKNSVNPEKYQIVAAYFFLKQKKSNFLSIPLTKNVKIDFCSEDQCFISDRKVSTIHSTFF